MQRVRMVVVVGRSELDGGRWGGGGGVEVGRT